MSERFWMSDEVMNMIIEEGREKSRIYKRRAVL